MLILLIPNQFLPLLFRLAASLPLWLAHGSPRFRGRRVLRVDALLPPLPLQLFLELLDKVLVRFEVLCLPPELLVCLNVLLVVYGRPTYN